MRRRALLLSALGLAALFAGGGLVHAGEAAGRLRLLGRRYSVVVGGRVYAPNAASTRSLFGARTASPEIRLWAFDARRGASFEADVLWLRLGREERRAQFFAATAGVRFVLARPGRALVPFVAARGGPYFSDAEGSGLRVRPGLNFEAGVAVGCRLALSIRQDLFPEVQGRNLRGLSLAAFVKVF